MTGASPGRFQQEGRRIAIAFLALTIIQVVVGPFGIAANILTALGTGLEPGVPWEERAGTIERWRGALPFMVPWWVFLVLAVAAIPLLWALRDRRRHHFSVVRGKVILLAVPIAFGILGVVFAAMVLGASAYYTSPDAWPGLYLVPVVVNLVVGVAGFVLTVRTPRRKARRA